MPFILKMAGTEPQFVHLTMLALKQKSCACTRVLNFIIQIANILVFVDTGTHITSLAICVSLHLELFKSVWGKPII